MIRHLHQAEVERCDRHWQLIARAGIDRFKFADFRLEKVIRSQMLRVTPHLGDAPVVLECFDQQRLHQHGDAIGPERIRKVVEPCPVPDQGDAIGVETLRGRRNVHDEPSVEDSAGAGDRLQLG